MRKLLFVTLSTLLIAGSASGIQARKAHQAKAGHMKWMADPALPAGAMAAVVKGDPSKAGSDFIVRIKAPANYTVPPHHHPTDETVRVLSGGPLTYGMGEKVDKASSASLTKGYHVTMQAGMNHWASTDVPTTVQVSGKGPFEIVYVNPKDDPRNAK